MKTRKQKYQAHRKKVHQNKPTHNEMARKLGIREVKARQFIKRQLINSKGAICGICGKPITNMKDCTIDHIIPVSKGGQTTIDNCQLAHFWCNQEKDDQIIDKDFDQDYN